MSQVDRKHHAHAHDDYFSFNPRLQCDRDDAPPPPDDAREAYGPLDTGDCGYSSTDTTATNTPLCVYCRNVAPQSPSPLPVHQAPPPLFAFAWILTFILVGLLSRGWDRPERWDTQFIEGTRQLGGDFVLELSKN